MQYDSTIKCFPMMCHNSSVHFYCVLCLGLEVIKILNSIFKVISDYTSQENF